FDSRKPMAKREEVRDDEYAPPPRRVHFDEDEGRASEEFVAKLNTRVVKRPDRDDQPVSSFGKAAPRPAGGKKPFGEKKPFGDKKPFEDNKSFDDKTPFGDKKPFGAKQPFDKKPFGERPTRDGAGRPEGGARPPQGREFVGTPRRPRRSDAGADGAPREFTPRVRPDSERGDGAAFKGEAKRPGRNFSEKPARFRADGERPQQRGERPPQRSERPRQERPGRDEFGSEAKTYGKPRMRPDGKPMPKRDGAAPVRGPRPGGFSKPGGFGKPGGGAARPAGGGRPS